MCTNSILHIALVGPSVSGKTTFISSVLSESVRNELLNISSGNVEGQTKVSVHYELDPNVSDNVLQLNSIAFVKKSTDSTADGYVSAICRRLQIQENMVTSEYDFKKGLYVITIHDYNIDASALYSIVNRFESLSDNVSYIHVSVCPSVNIKEFLNTLGYGITLVDTRGLMDEIRTPSIAYGSSSILRDMELRGLFDIDVCVYFHVSGVVLTQHMKNYYECLLRKLTRLAPVFYVSRSSDLSVWMYGKLGGEKLSLPVINSILSDKNRFVDDFYGLPTDVIVDKFCIESQAACVKGCKLLLAQFNYSADNFKEVQLPLYIESSEFTLMTVARRTLEFKHIVLVLLPSIQKHFHNNVCAAFTLLHSYMSDRVLGTIKHIQESYSAELLYNFMDYQCEGFSVGFNGGLIRPTDCDRDALRISQTLLSSCGGILVDLICKRSESGMSKFIEYLLVNSVLQNLSTEDIETLHMYLHNKVTRFCYCYSSPINEYCIRPSYMSEHKDAFMKEWRKVSKLDTNPAFTGFVLNLLYNAIIDIVEMPTHHKYDNRFI